MDPQLQNHLVSLCNAVGGIEIDLETETENYVLGVEALDCLRDIKRVLRHDDKTEDKLVLRALGQWRFLHSDLIPILKHYTQDKKIVEAVLELVVPLTFPVEKEKPYANEQKTHIESYTVEILEKGALDSIFQLLIEPLSVDEKERTPRDVVNIRLLLTLCRNLLRSHENSEDQDPMVLEKLLVGFQSSNLIELFVTFASSIQEPSFTDWNMIVLDIFHSLFCHLSVKALFRREQEQKALASTKSIIDLKHNLMNNRHPRFGGALVFQYGANARFVTNAAAGLNANVTDIATAKSNKTKKRQQKKSKKTDENTIIKYDILTKKIEDVVCGSVESFIQSGFNALVSSTKSDLIRERQHVREEDYVHFSAVVSFCLEYFNFARSEGKELLNFNYLASMLNIDSITFILKCMMNKYMDKQEKQLILFSETLTQLLNTINLMNVNSDEAVRDIADNLQRNLFYKEDYLKLLQRIASYPLSLSISSLEVSVKLTHCLLKTLDRYLKNKQLIVARTRRKRAQNDTMGDNSDSEEESNESRELKEVAFEYVRFELGYASESCLNNFFVLLKKMDEIQSETIHYIARMFHRLFVKCEAEAVFYKMEFLDIINDVLARRRELTLKHKECAELVQFFRFFISKFFKKLSEYPELYVEILFSKSKGDWRRIQFGDQVSQHPKLKAPKKSIEREGHLSQSEDEESEGEGSRRPKKKTKRRIKRRDSDDDDGNLALADDDFIKKKLSEELVEDSDDDEDDDVMVEYYRRRMVEYGGIPQFFGSDDKAKSSSTQPDKLLETALPTQKDATSLSNDESDSEMGLSSEDEMEQN